MIKSASFMVIGGANIDITGKALSSSSMTAQSHRGHIAKSSGGVARNIAESLGRLGQSVTLLSAFGDDDDSQAMQDELSSAHVFHDLCVMTPHHKADSYMAIYDEAGSLITAINDMPLIETINGDVINHHQNKVKACDKIVIDANLSPDAINAICAIADDNQLVADAVSLKKAEKLKPYLSSLSLLKVTYEEACQLMDIHKALTPDQILDDLHEKGIQMILLSQGAAGFTLSTTTDRLSKSAETDIDIVNSSGAGDGLFAGTLYGLSQGYDIAGIAEIARNVAKSALASPKAVNPLLTSQQIDPFR